MRSPRWRRDFAPIDDLRDARPIRLDAARALLAVPGPRSAAHQRTRPASVASGRLQCRPQLDLRSESCGCARAPLDAARFRAETCRRRATFIDDIREPEGLLHIAVGGAPVAAGQCSVWTGRGARGARVVAVLTAADIPGVNDVSAIGGRRPGVRLGNIEFHGQVVFAVVAKTRDEARRAAKHCQVAASTTALRVRR